MNKFTFSIFLASFFSVLNAQISSKELAGQLNTITTMVPFLGITPDSRSGAMGDVGVALFNPDANSVFWNAANMVNAKEKMQFSLSYSPWLAALVDDVGLSYLSGTYLLNKKSAVGFDFRYFSLGNINFTDINGNETGKFTPNEVAIGGAYALKFNRKFSTGVNLRYIYSNLTGNPSGSTTSTTPGQSVAGDVNLIYNTNLKIKSKGTQKNYKLNIGLNLQNIGSKMTYTNREKRDFIPTNFKVGAGLEIPIDDFQSVNIYFDINKLLVPTRPLYLQDYRGRDSVINNVRQFVGNDPNVNTVQGMVQSWYDAPGGFREELKEYIIATGLEYIYNKQFSARLGYFYESPTKGNRRYITAGLGIKYKKLEINAAYLIPIVSNHPLRNQLRFSLNTYFDNTKE